MISLGYTVRFQEIISIIGEGYRMITEQQEQHRVTDIWRMCVKRPKCHTPILNN